MGWRFSFPISFAVGWGVLGVVGVLMTLVGLEKKRKISCDFCIPLPSETQLDRLDLGARCQQVWITGIMLMYVLIPICERPDGNPPILVRAQKRM